MKLIKTASGKYKLTKKAWEEIGRKAGWMKIAQMKDKDTKELERASAIRKNLEYQMREANGWLSNLISAIKNRKWSDAMAAASQVGLAAKYAKEAEDAL